MKCLYCPNEFEIKIHDPQSKSRHCTLCNVAYYLNDDYEIMTIIWMKIIIKEKIYAIKIYPGPYTGNAPEFIISYFEGETICLEGSPVKIGEWYEILRWDFIPKNWTPQNVQERLINYLPFL